MEPTIKLYWKITPQPYSDYEIILSKETVLFKEWWDPGRDPNRYETNLVDFETSALAEKIRYLFSESIYQEVLTSVKKLLEEKV